eukprot:s926_g4.t1
MASPRSSFPSASVLRDLLRQARDGGSIDDIMALLLGDRDDADFELLSDGTGAMSDASKRRMTSPPAREEREATMSGSEAAKKIPSESPASFAMKLPAGIKDVDQWGKTLLEVSKFDWQYSGTETAYVLQGEVLVTPTGEWASCKPTKVEAGDLVVFPDGMTCVWDVTKPIKKHFSFS